MTMHTLWIVWAAITAVVLGLLLYRAMLTRYEEDQLFLDDAVMSNERARQEEIQHKLHMLQPYVGVAGAISSLLLVGLVGTVTWRAWEVVSQHF